MYRQTETDRQTDLMIIILQINTRLLRVLQVYTTQVNSIIIRAAHRQSTFPAIRDFKNSQRFEKIKKKKKSSQRLEKIPDKK